MNKDSKPDSAKIIFVYNADSGMANALLDYGKKYIRPSKYDCELCMVTFGAFGMKKDWRSFVDTFPFPVEFMHKDELIKKHDYKGDLPAVFILKNKKLDQIISSTEFEKVKSLDDLKKLVTKKVK